MTKPLEVDITEALFPPADLTPEEKRKNELWGLAQDEAKKELGDGFPLSPIAYYNATERIYRASLKKEGLKYDEDRGL